MHRQINNYNFVFEGWMLKMLVLNNGSPNLKAHVYPTSIPHPLPTIPTFYWKRHIFLSME